MINYTNESKTIKDKKEEALINRLLAINFSLKVIQAVIFPINTYKQEIIAVRSEKEIKTKKDGIFVIKCLCYHCWGTIIVYRYYIRLKGLFELEK